MMSVRWFWVLNTILVTLGIANPTKAIGPQYAVITLASKMDIPIKTTRISLTFTPNN